MSSDPCMGIFTGCFTAGTVVIQGVGELQDVTEISQSVRKAFDAVKEDASTRPESGEGDQGDPELMEGLRVRGSLLYVWHCFVAAAAPGDSSLDSSVCAGN